LAHLEQALFKFDQPGNLTQASRFRHGLESIQFAAHIDKA
jgi:hypothetical protein